MRSVSTNLYGRSVALVGQLERSQRKILLWWVAAASAACLLKLFLSSFSTLELDQQVAAALPYVLVVGAPAASFLLALRWFRNGAGLPQPEYRLARVGRWQSLSLGDARALPLYGVTGFMASLLLGLLINIPVRGAEFMTAIPPLAGPVPEWFRTLFSLMLLDVVLLSSLYAICFVAALRHVPLFPRLLAAVWGIDMAMQLGIGAIMAAQGGVPADVTTGLNALLDGNLKKVMISAAIWTPYLLMSKRVNLTFRLRRPAA